MVVAIRLPVTDCQRRGAHDDQQHGYDRNYSEIPHPGSGTDPVNLIHFIFSFGKINDLRSRMILTLAGRISIPLWDRILRIINNSPIVFDITLF
jgi:hypothetical protein